MIENICNWSRMKDFKKSQNIFTMVEEKLGFRRSELLQNEGFQNRYHRISSPRLKKFLNSNDLNYTRMKDFKTFITEYLHHGWRKFWISMILNAPEWGISTCLSQNIFTMVERIFEFRWSELHFFIGNSIFHLSLELLTKFWKTCLKVA
jgi:hypothetical protein